MTNQENQPQKPLLSLDEEQMEKVTGGFLNCLSCFGAPKTQETAPATAPQPSRPPLVDEHGNGSNAARTFTSSEIWQMHSLLNPGTSTEHSTVLPSSPRPAPR
jgi:hypothetical protein